MGGGVALIFTTLKNRNIELGGRITFSKINRIGILDGEQLHGAPGIAETGRSVLTVPEPVFLTPSNINFSIEANDINFSVIEAEALSAARKALPP